MADRAGLGPGDSPEIDTSVPHPARVYNYFLGGTDNWSPGTAHLAAYLGAREPARITLGG